MSEQKKLSVQDIITKYKKENGEGSVAFLSDKTVAKIETTSTGVLALDMLIGMGQVKGFPKGCIVESYGPESSFKTTTAIYGLINAMEETGKIGVILDAEHSLNRDLVEALGGNMDKILLLQPDTTQDTLTLVEDFSSTGEVCFIIVDSVAAMIPREELEGEMGDSKMGLQARLMSQGLRKLKGLVKRSGTCVVFINQMREKIGVMFGNPFTTTGGNALKYYATLRLEHYARPIEGKPELGRTITYKIIKSKLAACAVGTKTTTDYYFDGGFDKYRDLVEIALTKGLILQKGSWFSDPINEVKLGQGKESVIQFLKDNEAYYQELLQKFSKKEVDVAV